MRYEEITRTISEGISGNLYTDISRWFKSAHSVDQIIKLIRQKYKIDDTVDDTEIKAEIHKVLMSSDDQNA